MNKKNFSVVIIGAGISGITAAKKLQEYGHDTVILEKSRGIGGRISSRWSNSGGLFDHGCQFIPNIAKELNLDKKNTDTLITWNPKILASGKLPHLFTHGNCIGTPSLNSFPKSFADGLNIKTEWHVESIKKKNDWWEITNKDHSDTYFAKTLILSIPAPQAVKLLHKNNVSFIDKAKEASYKPLISILIEEKSLLKLPYDIYTFENSKIETVILQHKKPNRKKIGSAVCLTSEEYSLKNIDTPIEEIEHILKDTFMKLVKISNTNNFSIHKWRYALVQKPVGKPYLVDDNLKVICCGDWCLGESVNDALLSGTNTAKYVINKSK